mmetsp:Transcript_13602/g.26979  ORF Transcript_13602/g.26979 Transcript_13602/m.26979 type:complete len:366 (+) Transcript_13602:596-1693(+)
MSPSSRHRALLSVSRSSSSLGSDEPGGLDHVPQLRLDFVPLARLEAAVGDHPHSGSFLSLPPCPLLKVQPQPLSNGLDGGNGGGVHVVYTGGEVPRKGSAVSKLLQHRHSTTGILNRHLVSIKIRDGVGDLPEVAVAEVGDDVRLGFGRDSRESERASRPQEVRSLPILLQRQCLSERRLVHLNDRASCLLEVRDLVPEGPADLECLGRPRDVCPWETPRQNRGRPCQHTLHRLVGARLGDFELPHGHRRVSLSLDVANDDGRTNVPRAIGLDPPLFGEEPSVHLLSEELDHVGPLGFPVDEDVQPEGLLFLHALANRCVDFGLVLGDGQLALSELQSFLPHLSCLREGTDSRCRQHYRLQGVEL